MRTATEIVEAIVKHKEGFSKMIDVIKLDSKDKSFHKNVLVWDNLAEKKHREIFTSDIKKDDEQQWMSVLIALMLCIKKNQMPGCWVPLFNSLEELDLKLELMGV